MATPNTPHDSLFKAVFSDPQAAAAQFRALLPAELVAALDLGALEDVTSSFIDPALNPSDCDLFFAAPWNQGEHQALLILHEHQSEPDPFMCLKTLRYTVSAWHEWLKRQRNRPRKLPPLIAVVLYHGEMPWAEPRTLSELIDLPPALAPVLGPYLPAATFVLDDLNLPDDEAVRARDLPAAALLALLLFKHGRRDEDLLEVWRSAEDAVAELTRLPNWIHALAQLVRYTLVVGDVDREQLSEVISEAAGREGAEVVMTTAERLRAEGRVEGRVEGRAEGAREILLMQLREKFPQAVTAETEARIGKAELAQLDSWIRRVLKADSLGEVFAD